MAQSDFLKWFVAHHGKPVFKDPSEAQAARDNLNSARNMLTALEREMRRHDEYEARKQSACYAWNAKPSRSMAKPLAKCRARRPR